MKLMDKLKNALFEEEYVEVEEKPKQKPKREKGKPKSEKPIAKKISVPEKSFVKEKKVEQPVEDIEIQDVKREEDSFKKEKEFKFPMMGEDDFSITHPFDIIPDEKSEPDPVIMEEKKEEKPLYQASKQEHSLYDEHVQKELSQAYEKKQQYTGFKPSPIISPIYGVLDKNYTKDEVKEKREVRISTFSRDDLDLDAVRRKAYGKLEDDIFESSSEPIYDTEEVEENLLVDLSTEDTPSVNKVTVGDAEEYFEDLGLEYNKDYIDASKEKATGRRVKEEKKTVEAPTPVDDDVAKNIDDNDNLFDLIDSMYNEE